MPHEGSKPASEKELARRKRYYAKHRERIRARQAEYYKANREEIRAAQAVWRANNPDVVAANNRKIRPSKTEGNRRRNAEYREACRDLILEAKGTVCMDCRDALDPAKIHLHHRDPASKLFNVANFRHAGRSLDEIRDEIAKCDPLCRSCHNARHRDLR